MKSWFANKRPAPDEGSLAALDAELRATAPRAQAPTSLHRSIMRAVRAADRPSTSTGRLAFLRWMAMPAGAALALLVAWHSLQQSQTQEKPSLSAAASALEVGGQMARAVPSAVVAPLSQELQGLNQDLDNAAQYLLASMP